MSLVAYGSSDESSDEEVTQDQNPRESISDSKTSVNNPNNKCHDDATPVKSIAKTEICLPRPRQECDVSESAAFTISENDAEQTTGRIKFAALPKPQSVQSKLTEVFEEIEENDDIPLYVPKPFTTEKNAKQERTPVKISIPSLSEFKDVDEDLEKTRKSRPQPSKSGMGLFALLPPASGGASSSATTSSGTADVKKHNFVPHVLTKAPANSVKTMPKISSTSTQVSSDKSIIDTVMKSSPLTLDYETISEDDEEESGSEQRDYFSLEAPASVATPEAPSDANFYSIPRDITAALIAGNQEALMGMRYPASSSNVPIESASDLEPVTKPEKTLVSNVMNMPKDEILQKNKAEVGPKLPVPEQEFNVDAMGNVAIDDKAIEYLCGKRGVKRKDRMIDEANIIEINGEDMKPDEREWLVKALTEEPVQRPISMQGPGGPSAQSKKKHQITFLAHQAKAMEVELKNSWAQNRMARKQSQSKYGF